ncbi:hypothetical protein FEV53_18660 [Palleronia caenipelagi]|uniref:Transposase DDE domain-containing protein n=1 Tax=Palleronia caenipelagi TaxID=2489174 RepID=A0A547PKF2_9RHOB|nr:hypothetical protein FEV53_18660 [Palleronia caenipelagi]
MDPTALWQARCAAAVFGPGDRGCLTLRVVFGLALCQTKGFVRSLLRLIRIDLPVPDFSTLCRGGPSLRTAPGRRLSE